MYSKPTDTPCIGVCSTIYGDMICRGCKRHYQEVIDWNGYSEVQKLAVLKRLEQRLSQVMQQVCEVTDPALLLAKLQQHQIRYRPEWNPYCHAYQLLAKGAASILRIESYGIVLKPAYTSWSLPQLFQWVDEQVFQACLE